LKQLPKKSKSRRQPKPANPPDSARKWAFRLFAVVVIPLILLGGAEAVLRLAGYGYRTGFFKKIQIGTGEFYVNNDDFSLRFFPPQLARFSGPVRLAAKKSADTYRIFILGESAAMGDPEPAYAASRYLEALLSARYPKTHFEIVNLGITAINSHVILPIAGDCARHDGDLWIIYMGNNEMVGPFGAATVFGTKAPPLPMIRFNLAIQKMRLGQLLVNAGRKLMGGNRNAPSWGGMEMFIGNQLPADDPRKEVVYQNFSRNLHDIVKVGLDCGAKILLNTVAVNLKDCAPFASMSNSNLPATDRLRFDQFFEQGVQADDRGDFAGAAHQFESAAGLDPTVAGLQFRWGESLLKLTNYAAAHEHLQLACDDDALPFRTDSRLNALITATGRELANDKLVLFDAAGVLAAGTPSGLCGDETFYEHVHFDFGGSYQLGRAWAEQVAAMLPAKITNDAGINDWATRKACEHRLGLSDWNRCLIIQSVIQRMQQPPLSSQLNNDERMKKLGARVARLHSQMNPIAATNVMEAFQTISTQFPDDYCLHENFALFLQSLGDLPGAVARCRRVHDLIPQDCIADFQLGHLLEIQGQWAGAGSSLREAVEIRPGLTEGWIELGNVLAHQEKFADALASYSTAHKQRPQDAQIVFRRGVVLAKLNRHAEAMENYRAASKLNPSDWQSHYELGGELDAAGQMDAAGREFGEAARLNPGNPRAHFNYGVLLAKQGRLDDAQHELEETLRLEPGYTRAQEYLAQMQALKKNVP
jgi:tetratricopeptide (TPR) repeat protein